MGSWHVAMGIQGPNPVPGAELRATVRHTTLFLLMKHIKGERERERERESERDIYIHTHFPILIYIKIKLNKPISLLLPIPFFSVAFIMGDHFPISPFLFSSQRRKKKMKGGTISALSLWSMASTFSNNDSLSIDLCITPSLNASTHVGVTPPSSLSLPLSLPLSLSLSLS